MQYMGGDPVPTSLTVMGSTPAYGYAMCRSTGLHMAWHCQCNIYLFLFIYLFIPLFIQA